LTHCLLRTSNGFADGPAPRRYRHHIRLSLRTRRLRDELDIANLNAELADPNGWLWLHFNLSNRRCHDWLAAAPLSDAARETLLASGGCEQVSAMRTKQRAEGWQLCAVLSRRHSEANGCH
jgi:hypothetical protein